MMYSKFTWRPYYFPLPNGWSVCWLGVWFGWHRYDVTKGDASNGWCLSSTEWMLHCRKKEGKKNAYYLSKFSDPFTHYRIF